MKFGKKKKKDKMTTNVVRQGPVTLKCRTVVECSKELSRHTVRGNTHDGDFYVSVSITKPSTYSLYHDSLSLRSKNEVIELIDALAEAVESLS